MGDISKNFSRWEFDCHCGCGGNTADYLLILVLEDLRKHFSGRTVHIHSGYRCLYHNTNMEPPGSKNSRHMLGQAADVRVEGVSPKLVHAYLTMRYPNRFGIGEYRTFTHIDVSTLKRRW